MSRRRFRLSYIPWLIVSMVGLVALVAGSISFRSAPAAAVDIRASATRNVAPLTTLTSTTTAPLDTGNPVPPNSQVDGSRLKNSRPQTSTTAISVRSSAPARVAPPRGMRPSSKPVGSKSSQPPGATQPAIPTSIMLGGSHQQIRIVPIAVSSTGILEPPADIATAGWWVGGPRPGAPGRAVIAGHIDSTAGLGAFAALADLHVGDLVQLAGTAGPIRRYRVTDRQEIEKTRLDPATLNRTKNHSDILLVTCIGNFDRSTRSYDSNLLVTAVEVGR